MMVVVTVMAGNLHLIETLRDDPRGCQMLLANQLSEVENGAVQTARRFVSMAVLVLCLCITAASQARPKASSAQQNMPPPEARIDINHATVEELLKAPGMTPSWAGRIVRFRPYRTKQDLLDKGVVNSEVYDRIKDYVIAHKDKQ
jgi:DNA uptake protein ComE-like DNA-binding protein